MTSWEMHFYEEQCKWFWDDFMKILIMTIGYGGYDFQEASEVSSMNYEEAKAW